ncbi:energy transducer TonB [Psychrobacter sp. HD31]|uniref:energy transducer TonB n=1 Tax=Psychrobacter sp. HD31 TaxID=3112003 RepID=UPI003DA25560
MKKVLFTSLMCVALSSTAIAELTDLNTNKKISTVGSDVAQKAKQTNNVHELFASDAYWIKKPAIKIKPCFCTASGKPSKGCYKKRWSVTARMQINKQGNVNSVKILKSDADSRIERRIVRSLKRSKLAPFKANGQPVSGYVNLPIRIKNDAYNPNLQCPVLSPSSN